MNCTFTIVDDSGKPVTSIAPGAYQVDVRTPVVFGTLPIPIGMASTDFTACKGVPMFQLAGPGVNVSTTMTAGCRVRGAVHGDVSAEFHHTSLRT